MREGVFPKWEDSMNIMVDVGLFVMCGYSKYISELTMAMIGEYLYRDVERNDEINGLSIVPKRILCN